MKRLVNAALFLALALSLAPQTALGLAGLAEHTTWHDYNAYAILAWEHPSDLCRVGKWCFRLLHKPDNRPFHQLEDTLLQIVLPPGPEVSLVLVQREATRDWLLYDLAYETTILQTERFEDAQQQWDAYGYGAPRLVDARSIDQYFKETSASWWRRLMFSLWWWVSLVFILLAGPFLTYTTYRLFRDFRTQHRKRSLLFSVLCLIPSAFFWFVIAVWLLNVLKSL